MQEQIYRVYVTDALKAKIGLNARYYELAFPRKLDERSGEEISNSIMEKLKKLGGEEN